MAPLPFWEKQKSAMDNTANDKASSLRWKILRRALLSRSSPPDSGNFIFTGIQFPPFHAPNFLFYFFEEEQSQMIIKRISRRTSHGFNFIPSHVIDDERDSTQRDGSSTRDARVCYTLPIPDAPQLFLTSVCCFLFSTLVSISRLSSNWEILLCLFIFLKNYNV